MQNLPEWVAGKITDSTFFFFASNNFEDASHSGQKSVVDRVASQDHQESMKYPNIPDDSGFSTSSLVGLNVALDGILKGKKACIYSNVCFIFSIN